MGRYYSGDIEGKFWFGVQSSDDADFFGSSGEQPEQPSVLEYFVNEEHLPEIKKGIKECEKALTKWKPKLDKFFKENNGYNEKMLEDQIGLKEDESREVLQWYARLYLGNKILKCVEDNKQCAFTAEC